MGRTADAKLFWGLADPEWYKYPWKFDISERDLDWEERAVRVYGYDRTTMFFEVKDDIGCTIETHGQDSDPLYFVAVEASLREASRGDIEILSESNLIVRATWEETLRTFCDKMEIEWSEPGWKLVCWRG